MSDLLTHTVPAPTQSAPVPDEPTPLDRTPLPPPPPTTDDDQPDRRRLLAVIGGLALLAAVVMGLLWTSARSDRDNIAVERDAAQAASAAETDRAEQALAELSAARTDLNATSTDNERLASESSAAEAAAAEAVTGAEEAAAAAAELEALNAELAAEIDALKASVAEAEAATAAATDAAGQPPADVDVSAAAEFVLFIGESIGAIDGPSVLGEGQHSCLGAAVIGDIGVDAVGAGLQSGASSSASSTLVDAINRGAAACGIDPSAIF